MTYEILPIAAAAWALIATTTVLTDMSTAPISGDRTMPQRARRAASGIATTYVVSRGPGEVLDHFAVARLRQVDNSRNVAGRCGRARSRRPQLPRRSRRPGYLTETAILSTMVRSPAQDRAIRSATRRCRFVATVPDNTTVLSSTAAVKLDLASTGSVLILLRMASRISGFDNSPGAGALVSGGCIGLLGI